MSKAKASDAAECEISSRVRAVVLAGDFHCGCQLGLCPFPSGVRLDSGGTYQPSKSQRVVWRWWQTFWGRFLPDRVGNDPVAVILGGEAVEGVHHRATTPITHNLTVQRKLAERVLRPVAERAEGRLFALRGTEAHSGVSGEHDEHIAERLGAVPDAQGQYARYALRLRVGRWTISALHHIGAGTGIGSEPGILARELVDEFTEAARWGTIVPDIVARFHVHRSCRVHIPTAGGEGAALSVAAWQLKTPFVWKIRYGRVASPHIGAAVIVFHKDHYTVHPFVRTIGAEHVQI